MPALSAYELADRLSNAKPMSSQAVTSKLAFLAAGNDAELEAISDNSEALSLVDTMRLLKSDSLSDVSNSSIVYAGAFALSATNEEERAELGAPLMARQLVSLAMHRSDNGEALDLKESIRDEGFPEADREAIRHSVFNGSYVPGFIMRTMSGGVGFSSPDEKDEEFASKVLSSQREHLAGDDLALKSSLAVEALDIDPSGPDSDRLLSSLGRVSVDARSNDFDITVPDLAVRLASDVAAQARAERLVGDVGMDETDIGVLRIHEAAMKSPALAEDLQKESRGLFHEMSAGSAIELRSDMETGSNLPVDMVRLIKINADAVERREASVNRENETVEIPMAPAVDDKAERQPLRAPTPEMSIG